MKIFFVLAILCFAVAHGTFFDSDATTITHHQGRDLPRVYDYEDGLKCPGANFYNDCNRCYCLDDGHSAACTRRGCPKRKITTRSVQENNNHPQVYDYQDGDECPARLFYNDCNRCICGEDGYSAACTRKACEPNRIKRQDNKYVDWQVYRDGLPVVYEYQSGYNCPGKQFYLDCNLCTCDDTGFSAGCTRMMCPPL